jgi:uncharacterized membrane protein YebE (DUF533 family)
MHEQDKAILQSLVSVAWADGQFDDRERQMLDALLESFGASDEDATEIRSYAETSKSLDDIPLTGLSAGDRRTLMHHAVILSWVDGEQHDTERSFLNKLRERLSIPQEECDELCANASDRAQSLLNMLSD